MPDVKMPQLGESVTEGTIGKWLKAPGDTVTKYEPIAEVVTDKVTAEIPSDFDGVFEEIFIAEGETVKVGTVVCRIATEGDTAGAGTVNAGGNTGAHPSAVRVPDNADSKTPEAGASARQTGTRKPQGRFSPAVLRLAEEHGIDLFDVHGTGEDGRITRKDVLTFVESGRLNTDSSAGDAPDLDAEPAAPVTPLRPSTAPAVPVRTAEAFASGADEEVVEPTPIRKTIARRMLESKHNAPHAWTMVEADVSKLVGYRTRVKGDFKRKEGIDLTYLPFFIKAVVEGLKKYPMLNASWVDEKIVMKKRINISIAVATDDSLVVPVIHDADHLSIAGIAHRVNELAAKARRGKLSMADVEGGTFTVNNTGAFGSILSQPILNAPQSAILSVESIVKRPVVVQGDAIAVRSMVNLCMSLDHRILDGWISGQFLKAVRERLEAFDEQTVIY